MQQESIEQSLIGRVVAGRYEIVEKLTSGSHSLIFWGRNVSGGPDAAIKVTSEAADDPFASDRLNREGTVLQMLQDQPASVKLYDRAFAEDGRLLLITELLDGMSLEAILERGERRIDLDELVSLFGPVVQTLSSLHGKGIIHRDINPTNLYRSWDPPGLKLLGFGEAKFIGAGIGADGRYCGIPKYVAPEVWLGKPDLDQRADIYSLAVTLFRCLAGRCPFESESSVELVDVVPRQERPSMVALCEGLPEALDDWMTIALSPEREGRFDNVNAMWSAFLRASGSWLPDSSERHQGLRSA